jgi:succinate dehydrogenase / fumarate reductase cytochrome b subunit
MAITGGIIVLFLFGHAIGNLQMFAGADVYNNYAYFLQSLGELLWVIRIVLFVCLVLHIITSVRLKLQNLGAKPVKYHVKNYMKAKLTARTMIWTGILIGSLLVYHILHFTAGTTNPDQYKHYEYYGKNAKLLGEYPTGKINYEGKQYAEADGIEILFKRHDVYKMVVLGFREPLISLAYIIFVLMVGFHLSHAIQSAFQTLGFNHPRYFPKIEKASVALSTLLVLCFVSVPIAVLLRIVGGAV